MITSPFMNLTIWNLSTDEYSNSQLASNFLAIDSHTHVGGAGAPIVTASISNNAITNPLINPGAVQGSAGPSTTNIYPASITSTEIANGTITAANINPTAFSSIVPLGTCISWYRPSNTISVPTGWVFAEGQVLGPTQHSFAGGGNITLPNLINNFVQGAQPGGTGNNGPNAAPGELAYGGSNAQNFNHEHNVNAHTHDLSNHGHSIGTHVHSISTDGEHSHTFSGGTDLGAFTIHYASGGSTFRYVWDPLLIVDGPAIMDPTGAHNHGALTGGSGLLNSGAPSINLTSSVPLVTNTQNETLPSDLRPNFVGLAYIIYVYSG